MDSDLDFYEAINGPEYLTGICSQCGREVVFDITAAPDDFCRECDQKAEEFQHAMCDVRR